MLLLKRGKCSRVNGCEVATVTEPRLKVFLSWDFETFARGWALFRLCRVPWMSRRGSAAQPIAATGFIRRGCGPRLWQQAVLLGAWAWSIPKCAAVTAPPPKWPLPSAAASHGRHLPTLWSSSFVRWCIKDQIPFRKGDLGRCTHHGERQVMKIEYKTVETGLGWEAGSVATPGRANSTTIL